MPSGSSAMKRCRPARIVWSSAPGPASVTVTVPSSEGWSVSSVGAVAGALGVGVVEELAAHPEGPPRQLHVGLARMFQLGQRVGREEVGDVAGIERRADRRYRPHLGDRRCGGENGGTAEAVADEQGGRLISVSEHRRSTHEILDVRRERGVGELTAASTETGEIEAQHPEPPIDQAAADA